jgi:hypothetical protein
VPRVQIAVEKPLGVKIGARGGREGGVIVKVRPSISHDSSVCGVLCCLQRAMPPQ